MHRFDYSIPQYSTCVQEIVSKVLHVPRVAHLDYLGCQCLKTMSKDELSSLFCETPSFWGNCQNTSCSAFAKGPRFLNMVMTFILHPLSHYNTITQPRARFLLSLIEGSLLISFHTLYSPLQISIRTRRLVINSSFLPLSRGSFTTFL